MLGQKMGILPLENKPACRMPQKAIWRLLRGRESVEAAEVMSQWGGAGEEAGGLLPSDPVPFLETRQQHRPLGKGPYSPFFISPTTT